MTDRNATNREYDIVVWGATGFIGRLIVEHLFKTYGVGKYLRWAMAGRNPGKCEAARDALGEGARSLPILIADSRDRASLETLAASTRVVCSAVGPFMKWGSELVAACVRNGTDYCDLSGETHWMRKMIELHETQARENKVRIVHACGLDSAPSDLGTLLVQQLYKQRNGAYSPEVSMRITKMKNGILSGGTYATVLDSMALAARDKVIRKHMFSPNDLTPPADGINAPAVDIVLPRWERDVGGWVAPFLMAGINTKTVRRSNALEGYPYGREFLYGEGISPGRGVIGWLRAVGETVGQVMFMLLGMIGPTRFVLRRLVTQPGDGPNREKRESGSYEILFTAKHPEDGSRNAQIIITGDRDPGYGSSSRMIGECAVCLAKETAVDELPGGFWTPASAFGQTLVNRLQAHAGIRFRELPAGQNYGDRHL